MDALRALRALRAAHQQRLPIPTPDNTTACDALAIVAKVTADPVVLRKLAAVDRHLASECLPKARAVEYNWMMWKSVTRDRPAKTLKVTKTKYSIKIKKRDIAQIMFIAYGLYGLTMGRPNVASRFSNLMAVMPWSLPFTYTVCRGSRTAYAWLNFVSALILQIHKRTEEFFIPHYFMPLDE